MEPAVIGAFGRVAAAVMTRSSAPVTGATPERPDWDEETDERGGLILKGTAGEALTVLTQDQVAQISEFVMRPESVTLCQFMFIARIGMKDEKFLSELSHDYMESFSIQAEEFCEEHGYNWANLADNIWQLLVAYTEEFFPLHELTSLLSGAEVERVTAYVGSAPQLSGTLRPPNIAFRDVVDILGNPDRYRKSREAISDIRAASERRYSELNLSHTLSHAAEDFRFDRADLYVARSLRAQNVEGSRNDDFLASPVTRPRCVVIGNPGVGKSTMTQHLVHRLSVADDSASTYAPIVISCKDVPNTEGNAFILDHIVRSLRESLQLDIQSEVINDLATLGRTFVIFDGVDEIINIARRQNFVRTVEAFANRYPLIPVLVTARRVGYSKARLSPKEFALYELDDFSDAQVVEYTHKWFSVTERSEQEREAFLRETENVPDVRTNPLMLSLLCVLYRARGYIPRNRRTVYESCADLLFQRWDAMRHIEQPVDHRQYGTRLMQELALFFYKSQAAQAGVQERQLRKLISQFFTDTASVEEHDARSRAQDFLDFCADRAWLLSYQGTDSSDQRLFGFTHRTFMEYFAAEAIVRRSRSIGEIAQEVAKAYELDTSSVLADVIFQCADDKYDGGAKEIVAGLMEKSRSLGRQHEAKYLALCLRIMNSAPLPPHSTDAIFDALLSYWERAEPEDTYSTSLGLFELSRDPRNRMISKVRTNDVEAVRVLRRWARFYWRSETTMFDPQWDEEAYQLAANLQEGGSYDPPLMAYLLRNKLRAASSLDGRERSWLLGFQAFGELVVGPLLRDLEELLWYDDIEDAGEIVKRFATDVMRPVQRTPYTDRFYSDLYEAVASGHLDLSTEQVQEKAADPIVMQFLVWSCLALYEIYAPSYHPFHDLVDFSYGKSWFGRVTATRLYGVGQKSPAGEPAPFTSHELRHDSQQKELPAWYAEWCRGDTTLIPEPH
ncbi:NACHT domain-containing protein [Streptomyces sp. NPDC017260]|uniref:NACHT domain-containing protein n=1 Tax=unclassified Streptomyces TaxID=2593676 RepID=UPI0037A576AD